MSDRSFEDRYQQGDIPWDRDAADHNLIDTIKTFGIKACPVLDLGCGTGINALWLAMKGFDVTGIDLSPTAIQMAEDRTSNLGYDLNLFSCDFLDPDTLGGSFDLVFDRGAFHCFDGMEGRTACAVRVADLLSANGWWLSLIGNADDQPREEGPPTMTAREIMEIVEPMFEIVSLTSGYFGGEQEDPPKAWICLMKKRRS